MTILDQPHNKTDKVRRACDLCDDIAYRRYSDLMNSRRKFAKRSGKYEEKDYCPQCAARVKMTGKFSPTKNLATRRKMSRNRRVDPDGKLSPGFINRGYRYILSSSDKYIAEHRFVMSQDINRSLTKEEQVHHVDGIKLNNDINNLYLCINASKHNRVHHSLESIAFELVRTGIIKFDNTKGEYYV